MTRDAGTFWNESFAEQSARRAFNTAPVESLVRNVSYHLRDRFPGNADDPAISGLHFLEIGCGAGPNLRWLAARGLKVSGIDVSTSALALARETLAASGLADRVVELREGRAGHLPFPDGSLDGVVEACVLQHVDREERIAAFSEIGRVLKPGGLFCGYMLGTEHTVYRLEKGRELTGDPGTLRLEDGLSKIYLTNLGTCHFYRAEELRDLLAGFALVDPCPIHYALPRFEAKKRGYDEYIQAMWAVYAVK